MASARREIPIAAPAAVSDAIMDLYRADARVAPDFLTHLGAEDGAPTVTFSNGAAARKMLVHSAPVRRRLAYAIPDGVNPGRYWRWAVHQ